MNIVLQLANNNSCVVVDDNMLAHKMLCPIHIVYILYQQNYMHAYKYIILNIYLSIDR